MIHSTLSSHHLRIFLLGDYHITHKGKSICFPTRKIDSLFAYLTIHQGVHSREKLATLFWGESPHENARRSLRQALTNIRKHIDKNIILADRESVSINPSFPLWVDADEFQNQAQQFLKDSSSLLKPFNIELYPGEFMSAYYDDWILPLKEYYNTLFLNVMLHSVEHLRARSEYADAIEYAQQIIARDVANERAHQHLMFCYITRGDRNQALQQYDACQHALQEELGVEPTRETQELYHWIKESILSIPTHATKITNLPIPISSFVGRNQELAQIKQFLSIARLVTLVGVGGSGKTRLAIHVATDLIDKYKDGVWWVEFRPLVDPSLVPHAVAKALGMEVDPQQSVIEAISRFLRKKQLLLVLDNCEHLIHSTAELIVSLLSSNPGLKILATSREVLEVKGEYVWVAPGLSVPEKPEITLANFVMQYEAVQLFMERARAVKAGFVLSESNALLVAQICQRLDGIPLAIELAAARIRMMSLEQIAFRLDDRFNLLTSGDRIRQDHHSTLRATVDWSYDLLTDDERVLFCRLSVFSGGWSIESAEAVCSGEGIDPSKTLDLIAHLLDKSLITVDECGERYDMLETIRAYAREKLAETGNQERIVQYHLDYFLHLTETADEKIRGSEQLVWMERIQQEHDNLTSAMEYALYHQDAFERGVLLVCALAWYWGTKGDFISARYWLEKALNASEALGRTPPRAKILFNAGFLSAMGLYWLSPVEIISVIEESLDIWHELEPEYVIEKAKCFLALGFTRKTDFNDDQGLTLFNNSVDIFRRSNQTWWHAWALNLSILIFKDAAPREIRSILKKEVVLWKEIGDKSGLAMTKMDLGILELKQENYIEAQKSLLDSLEIFKEMGLKGYILQTLRYLGIVSIGLNQYDRAERYYKESIPFAQSAGLEYVLTAIYLELGFLALHTDDLAQAADYLFQSLNLSLEYKRNERVPLCLAGFAALAVSREIPQVAAKMFGAYTALYKEYRHYLFISPVIKKDIDHYLKGCREQLGVEEFDRVWNEGVALTVDEAVEEMLGIFQPGIE